MVTGAGFSFGFPEENGRWVSFSKVALQALFFGKLFTDEAFYYFYDLHSSDIAFLWEIKEVW